jgi:hypothetical protein
MSVVSECLERLLDDPPAGDTQSSTFGAGGNCSLETVRSVSLSDLHASVASVASVSALPDQAPARRPSFEDDDADLIERYPTAGYGEPVFTNESDDGAITRDATRAWLTQYSPKVVWWRTEREIHAVLTNTRVYAACAQQCDSSIQN